MYFQTIITPATLADNLYKPNWLILDCRGALLSDNTGYKNYTESHISNAYYYCSIGYACNETSTSDSNRCFSSEPDQMENKLRDWGFDKSTQIIIYEALNSSFTDKIWLNIRSSGFQNVAVLQGGFTSWREQNLPTSSDTDKQ